MTNIKASRSYKGLGHLVSAWRLSKRIRFAYLKFHSEFLKRDLKRNPLRNGKGHFYLNISVPFNFLNDKLKFLYSYDFFCFASGISFECIQNLFFSRYNHIRSSRKAWLKITTLVILFPFLFPHKKEGRRKRMLSKNRDFKPCLSKILKNNVKVQFIVCV